MIRNMGMLDRGLRTLLVAPAAIVVAFALGSGTVGGVILFAVAAIMLATAMAGFCPTYVLLGISTQSNGVHRVGHHLRGGHA